MSNIVPAKVSALKPEPIDDSRCTQQKSLFQQITDTRNSQGVFDRQENQFKKYNLGNGLTMNDPIATADYLLKREYVESFLFDSQNYHKALFIPPVFESNQYHKKLLVSILDYDVMKDVEKTLGNMLKNSPSHWFTTDFQAFIQMQKFFTRTTTLTEINSKEFEQWITKSKIKHLVVKELQTDQNLPQMTIDIDIFIQKCLIELKQQSKNGSNLETFLQHCSIKLPRKGGRNKVRADVNKLVSEPNVCEDSNIKWLWDLQLSDLGEEVEHWFFDQLQSIKYGTLNDLVILQSSQFMTNVENKKHREYDVLILSYSRKLVIGIELKRTSTDQALLKACGQLDKYRTSLEETLGDQFGSGWQFFPVICVQHDSRTFKSAHYINAMTDIRDWLSNVLKRFPMIINQTDLTDSLANLKNVLRIIVFAVHVSVPVTHTNWVDYISQAIDNVSTHDNLIFYSNQQLAAFKSDDPKCKKIFVQGKFGTGKSILLREKAKQICQRDASLKNRVVYITDITSKGKNRTSTDITSKRKNRKILQTYYLEMVLGPFGIVVEEFGPESTDSLESIVRRTNAKALFLDEWSAVNGEALKRISALCDVVWIAQRVVHYDPTKSSIFRNGFKNLELGLNLRNSREIVAAVNKDGLGFLTSIYASSPPNNFPCGRPVIRVDTLEKAILKARCLTSDGIVALVNYNHYYVNLKKEIISVMNSYTNEKWKLYEDITENENGYKLLNKGYVLFADYYDVAGFEWPTVIIIDDTPPEAIRYMRCTTNLIVCKIYGKK
ncbi:uncharacterized protein [Clytia hemisphaerica]|uniref:Uncharacterized protein n=1 Tax=Clytia hemisphaerica TaxID=252671 RepID=A0A7M5UU66_9CNID